MKIGLTGSIACGKSTVSQYLRQKGCFIVDADAISRALTADGGAALPEIRRAFGDDVFSGASAKTSWPSFARSSAAPENTPSPNALRISGSAAPPSAVNAREIASASTI